MNKIEALKQTIVNVESGAYHYNWTQVNSCNCGVVARTLLSGELPDNNGLTHAGYYENKGAFSGFAYCLTTGVELPKVFQLLKDAGFTYQELNELEYLTNPKVASKIGLSVRHCKYDPFPRCDEEGYKSKENLLRYLKAWVEILEEEQPKIQEPAKIAHSFSAVTFTKIMEAELISES